MRTVLLLAGTAEARALAAAFDRPDARLVASLAGATASPRGYACTMRAGGFGGIAGLRDHMARERIAALVDATHPFAARISANALAASRACAVPHLALVRPPWPVEPHWSCFDSLESAVAAIPPGARVLATTGRAVTAPLVARPDLGILLRSVDPVPDAPPHIRSLPARGPFTVAAETALMREHGVTHLLTRNAGGDSRARLDAASALGVSVHMIERPPSEGANGVRTVADALRWLDGVLRD